VTGAVIGLISADVRLAAEIRRLCAVAGQQLRVAAEPADVPRLWRAAALVLVDAVVLDATRRLDLVARDDVVVLAERHDDLSVWQGAVAVGARSVLTLSDDVQPLLDRLALAGESSGPAGRLLGVVGGCGGAGASTFAVALAAAGATAGATTLVDLDIWGGGLDLLVGLEHAAGLRWPDLRDARGVVAAAALYDGLPCAGALAVLSAARPGSDTRAAPAALDAGAVGAVVAAARRACALTVADLPRWPDDAAWSAARDCDAVFVVVPAEVRAVAAAASVLARADECCDNVGLVVRTGGRGRLRAPDVAAALGRPPAVVVPTDPHIAVAADEGGLLKSLARSRLGAAAAQLVDTGISEAVA
jgi:secretion/DNA translocation related CpaE-like protein